MKPSILLLASALFQLSALPALAQSDPDWDLFEPPFNPPGAQHAIRAYDADWTASGLLAIVMVENHPDQDHVVLATYDPNRDNQTRHLQVRGRSQIDRHRGGGNVVSFILKLHDTRLGASIAALKPELKIDTRQAGPDGAFNSRIFRNIRVDKNENVKSAFDTVRNHDIDIRRIRLLYGQHAFALVLSKE